jgi:hypothetical protein
MKLGVIARVLGAGVCLFPGSMRGLDCSGLPTSFGGNPFPTGDFFTNFDNACYTIALATGHGSANFGDLNAVYFQMYFKVDPRYQLIILGTYPNARYFSVSLYDDHSAYAQSIPDTSIVPLTSGFTNPYLPGVSFISGQKFAVPVNFGGTPGLLETGCMMTGYNVDVNALDGTLRHAGMDWNSDNGLFQSYPNFAVHVVDTAKHTKPNAAGVVMIRAYLDITNVDSATSPHIIVRDVASGCAYPAAYALNTLKILSSSASVGGPWLDAAQGQAHQFYETSYLPKLCYSNAIAPNRMEWARQPEYVPGAAPDTGYVVATVPNGLPAALAAAGQVMRVQFRVPATPPTPCTKGCSRSGNEQMRYLSLSFIIPGGNTIASLADTAFTKDANGYATIIVGTGARVPAWITPANGYTFLNLTAVRSFKQLSLLDLRHISPAGTFGCAGQFVPYRTGAATPAGSLMGDYMPVVDYPLAATLPHSAGEVPQQACDLFPTGEPGVLPNCGVLPGPPPAVNSVLTQCLAPGCSQFVVQANPPVTITGGGFGSFPNGLPFNGTSQFLQITNHTQSWSAGYTGDACSVSISSWATNRIQLVANVNANGNCPLAAGDQLEITVWNPETLVSATAAVTVTSQ